MKIIIRSNSDTIIMELAYEEILKLLEVLKQDKSNYCKTVSVFSDKITTEDCEFIKHLKNYYDARVQCDIHTP